MSTWVNGRLSGTLAVGDRGLLYGDGVFETMRVRKRNVRLLDFHLQRLEEGCRKLGIVAAPSATLRAELGRAAAERAEGILKLIVTRGTGPRGYRPSGRERPTRVVSLHTLSPAAARASRHPVQIRLCSTRLGVNATLAGLKTLNRLESVIARSEWSDDRIWEGLMRDTDGHIVSGTMTNVFVRHGSFLMTPMLDRCGITGVMRRWILEQGGSSDWRPIEGRLNWDDLEHADEVFLSNAVSGVVSVSVITDGSRRIRVNSDEAARALRARLEAL